MMEAACGFCPSRHSALTMNMHMYQLMIDDLARGACQAGLEPRALRLLALILYLLLFSFTTMTAYNHHVDRLSNLNVLRETYL